MFSISLILFFFFFCNPFIAYLVFKGKGAIEVSYTLLFQIYAYSFSIFLPATLVYIMSSAFYRVKLFFLVISAGISLYYLYKEMREYIEKYFDETTMKQVMGYFGGSTVFFLVLFQYHFMAS
mmetsp:Transcript_26023/g.25244  ORF Transcript_26023/g.25244 Transcript_26023/m.25244 type:complete len:122 (+) Transcript_26023:526-891(+)